MLLRPEYLSQKLDRPLPTKDGGGTLHTIAQAVDYMTGIGKRRELLNHWQRVAKLILAKEDVPTVSRALDATGLTWASFQTRVGFSPIRGVER